MTYRVAAAAFAVPALFAAPAAADPVRGAIVQLEHKLGTNTSLTVQVASHDRYGRPAPYQRAYQAPRLNQWGQTEREAARLRRDAVQACTRAISREAYRIGYRDVDVDDDRRVRQIGAYGFRIVYDDVEFEGRRRGIERDVTCTVRRGNIARLEGIPAPTVRRDARYTVVTPPRGRPNR